MKTEKLFIKVRIGSGELYSIETNIELPITGKYYYLPTSYKEPVRVYLVDYTNSLSINNEIMIMATISYNNKLYDVTPNTLFNTKQKASEYYLQNYKKLDYKFLEGDKKELEKAISEFHYKVTITKKELELAFSSKLQRIRKMRRLTQRQLAEQCNISIKTLQSYEQGTRKLEKANKNTILKICEVLNCKISDIIESEVK